MTALALALAALVPQDLAAARQAVEAMREPKLPWKDIPWKTCLVEALEASRREQKPVLAWVFIDRPVDDARC